MRGFDVNRLDNFVYYHPVKAFLALFLVSAIIVTILFSVGGCEVTDKGIYFKEGAQSSQASGTDGGGATMVAINDENQSEKAYAVMYYNKFADGSTKYFVDTWTYDRSVADDRAAALNRVRDKAFGKVPQYIGAYVAELDLSDTGRWFDVSDNGGEGLWVETDSAINVPYQES